MAVRRDTKGRHGRPIAGWVALLGAAVVVGGLALVWDREATAPRARAQASTLSSDQQAMLNGVFDEIDVNQDDQVTPLEFRLTQVTFRVGPDPRASVGEQARQRGLTGQERFFEMFDRNRDGSVARVELVSAPDKVTQRS